jgi:hypothetical protein
MTPSTRPSATIRGSFADTKDVFDGHHLIEADDLGAAIALAAPVPAARMGGCVEVRPVRGFLRAPDTWLSAT